MAQERTAVREIIWPEVFPSVLLLSAWRVAIRFRVLIVAAVALFATRIGWQWLERVFGIAADQAPLSALIGTSAPAVPSGLTGWLEGSPPMNAWRDLSQPFIAALEPLSSRGHFCYLTLAALWGLAIWALAGGAICRISAVELSRGEHLSLGQGLSFARKKWPSLIAAPLYPMFGVLLATIPLAILGLVSRGGNFGIAVLGLFWPLVLVAGAVMAVLLVGLLFNWPLMWPTIATEGTDSFDALSRSYAYTFQRPLRYLGYVILAAVIGLLAALLVHLFGRAVLLLSYWAVSWGGGDRPMFLSASGTTGLSGLGSAGATLLQFWNRALELLIFAFGYGYFFVASTAIYLLLRLHVDAVEIDEVHLPDEGELYGMPPLQADAAGVPQAGDVTVVADSTT